MSVISSKFTNNKNAECDRVSTNPSRGAARDSSVCEAVFTAVRSDVIFVSMAEVAAATVVVTTVFVYSVSNNSCVIIIPRFNQSS